TVGVLPTVHAGVVDALGVLVAGDDRDAIQPPARPVHRAATAVVEVAVDVGRVRHRGVGHPVGRAGHVGPGVPGAGAGRLAVLIDDAPRRGDDVLGQVAGVTHPLGRPDGGVGDVGR